MAALLELPGATVRLRQMIADPDLDRATRGMVFDHLRQGDVEAFGALTEGLVRAPDGEAYVEARLAKVKVDEVERARWIQLLASPRATVAAVGRAALLGIGPDAHPQLVAQMASGDDRLRDRAMAFLVDEADDDLKAALQEAYRTGEPADRAGAVVALVRLAAGTDRVPDYLEALDDDALVVRLAAARALAATPHAESDRTLERRLPELAPPVRRAVLEGAASRPSVDPARRWAQDRLSDDDPSVRQAALAVLTPAPDATTVRRLQAFLAEASSAEKVQAVRAIGDSRVPEAGLVLVGLVTNPDPDVRQAALQYASGTLEPARR